ncbi:MAG TPA: gamma-glutamyl-gamma-aminobutyrate hydrolase family protein [Verrucomicrobiae bacterium]|jgi:putative glutamine amidotransferase|nr:gamma-glutamyl-gamma-aminobutyrate hydrolase family protein [Verrucomicrobiae bacterium]
MTQRPIILVTPCTQPKGAEFSDNSISLSNRYTDAVLAAGGLPVVFPATTDTAVIAEMVRRADGVMMTGGEDLDPELYGKDLPEELKKKAGPLEPDRDVWEQALVTEIFRQHKPVFGICRGHQMLNVALGGTLLVDIPTQAPEALNHRRMDRRSEPVHAIQIEPDSMLGKIVGGPTLPVNSTHHQALGRMAEALRPVAQSEDGIIEAAELRDPSRLPFFLTVQFHPERLVDIGPAYRQLFEKFVAACATARPQRL